VVFGSDMIINATYLTNWQSIAERCHLFVCRNSEKENATRLPFVYSEGQQVFIRVLYSAGKLDANEGFFSIIEVHTNGSVTICRSPVVSERINILCIHPA
jgi:hypothetical protein